MLTWHLQALSVAFRDLVEQSAFGWTCWHQSMQHHSLGMNYSNTDLLKRVQEMFRTAAVGGLCVYATVCGWM